MESCHARTVVTVFSEQDGGIHELNLWKGKLPHKVFKALLIIPPLYKFWGDTIFLVAVSSQLTRKEVCDCFWELDGWRTYWHNYCRTQPSTTPPHPFIGLLSVSSSSKMEETAAALVGFYPASSSLSARFSLFLSIFLYCSSCEATLSTSLYFSLSLYLPIHPSMPVFKVHLLPSLPSSLTPEQSPAVPHKDLLTQGKKKKKSICVTNNAVSMHWKKVYLKIVCFFVFLVLNVARNTNFCLCVRTCIQKGMITTVLDLFFFFV